MKSLAFPLKDQSHLSHAPLMLSISGLRGVVGQSLTPAVALKYAQAFGQWLIEHTGKSSPRIVLGRDSRVSGRMIESAVNSGLLSVGCCVTELGIVTTPSVGIMIDHLGADGGMVITASHNPVMWNGIKVLDAQGVSPPPAQVEKIIERFKAESVQTIGVDRLQPVQSVTNTDQVHVDRVLSLIDVSQVRSAKLRVVIDSVHGAGGVAARLLCDRLGVELAHLYAQPTGDFPHEPEPTAVNLRDLGQSVIEHGAMVGFAQDPDADRLAIIDEQGRYIGEEYSLALCAMHVLSRSPGSVAAANLSTSRMIDDVADLYGSRVLRTAVGEANVAKKMREHGAVIGGEGNGGVIWPSVGYVRDSISTIALVLELMARRGRSISQLVSEIPAYTIVKHKVDIRPGMVEAAVKALAGAYASERIDLQDGIRIDFAQGWLHVRPSNTEPILRIIAEARDQQQAMAMVQQAQKLIASL